MLTYDIHQDGQYSQHLGYHILVHLKTPCNYAQPQATYLTPTWAIINMYGSVCFVSPYKLQVQSSANKREREREASPMPLSLFIIWR